MNASPVQTALKLGEKGIPVFPCGADKRPLCKGGFKAATTNPEQIKSFFRNPKAELIGVPTGAASSTYVVDIDPRNGGDKWLTENRHKLPATRTHRTRSGGWHLFFRFQPGLGNTAGKLAPGVDTRGEGGYIIWWPACGGEIENGKLIADLPEWVLTSVKNKPQAARGIGAKTTSARPAEKFLSIAPIPAWASAEELAKDARRGMQNITDLDCDDVHDPRYAAAAFKNAICNVVFAKEGTRNDTLNREAFNLFRFVVAGTLDLTKVLEALCSAASAADLEPEEITSTVNSAMRARRIV